MFRPRLLTLLMVAVLPLAAQADSFLKPRAKTDDLLPVEQAFQLQGATVVGQQLEVKWAIAPGYYLYKHRMQISADSPAGAALGAAEFPKGEAKHDEDFGDVEVFRGALSAHLALAKGAKAPRSLRVRYQGCADIGVCYPPQTRLVSVAAKSK